MISHYKFIRQFEELNKLLLQLLKNLLNCPEIQTSLWVSLRGKSVKDNPTLGFLVTLFTSLQNATSEVKKEILGVFQTFAIVDEGLHTLWKVYYTYIPCSYCSAKFRRCVSRHTERPCIHGILRMQECVWEYYRTYLLPNLHR
jgi:hypothetical protein